MRGKTANGLIIEEYSKEYGVTTKTANEHRKKQVEQWLSWCQKKGYNSDHIPESTGGQQPINYKRDMSDKATENRTEEPEELVERYKLMEDKSYQQLRQIQALLDVAIGEGQFQLLRTYIQGVKDLTATYNELCRLRRIAEVQEGDILPMDVLDRYKTTFYPRLESGVDELRISIENMLPPDTVPDFQRAWQKSYYRYKDAAKEAEQAINNYKIIAADEALNALNKKESNKLKAQAAVREKVKEKVSNE